MRITKKTKWINNNFTLTGLSVFFLSMFTYSTSDGNKDMIAEKTLREECYQKYKQQIREQTTALSISLRQKVTERSNLLELKLKDDQVYRNEISQLKSEKKNKVKKKSKPGNYNEKIRDARKKGLGRLENKSEIRNLTKEINDLKKEIKAIISEITKNDSKCRKCFTNNETK